jgi:hypothetical protein
MTGEEDTEVSKFEQYKTERSSNMIRNLKNTITILVCQLTGIWL